MARREDNPFSWLFGTTPSSAEPDPEDPKYLVEGEYTLGSSDRYRQDQQHYAGLQAEKLKQQQIYQRLAQQTDKIGGAGGVGFKIPQPEVPQMRRSPVDRGYLPSMEDIYKKRTGILRM